jgi:hypothetical protein
MHSLRRSNQKKKRCGTRHHSIFLFLIIRVISEVCFCMSSSPYRTAATSPSPIQACLCALLFILGAGLTGQVARTALAWPQAVGGPPWQKVETGQRAPVAIRPLFLFLVEKEKTYRGKRIGKKSRIWTRMEKSFGRGGTTHMCGGGGVGGVRGWPDLEERCTRTPDSVSGHTPPRGKAKGAGGLY